MLRMRLGIVHGFLSGAIIGDGDHSELSFTIARATPCVVRFGLFLAQIAPSLQNKNRALHANCVRIWSYSQVHGIFNAYIVENSRKMIYKILMLLLQSSFRAYTSSIGHSTVYRHIISDLAGLKLSLSTPWRPRPFKKRKSWSCQSYLNQ